MTKPARRLAGAHLIPWVGRGLLALVFGWVSIGCAQETSPPESPALVYGKQLETAHAALDRAEARKDPQAAIVTLTRAFELPTPEGNSVAVWARQDLAERISRLYLELARPEESLRWAKQGIALDARPSATRAALFIAQADAWLALGSPDQARAALLQALTENESLLEAELQDP